MFRDRTNLYLSYRRTIPRGEPESNGFDSLGQEEEGLMGRRRATKYSDREGSIELQPIAPSIFELAKQLNETLNRIKSETTTLNSLYKKLLITSVKDKHDIESNIENLNYQITKNFETCYVAIKKFDFLEKNHQRLNLNYSLTELAMIGNFKKNYALKVQNASLIFRNLQNNYIKFLRDDDYDDSNDTTNLLSNTPSEIFIHDEENTKNIENYSKRVLQETQSQLQTQTSANDQFLQQREREISKLALGILEISTIFKEMETLVTEQGTILDRIDYNIENTAQDLNSSNKELLKAKSYQQRTTKCKVILLLTLVVFALLLVFLLKPTSSPQRPVLDKPPSSPPNDPHPERPVIDNPPKV